MGRDEPLVLDGMIESVQKFSNTAEEMEFLKSGVTTKARIMQTFGVNPIVVGEVAGANRASAAAADAHFCQTCVNPKITLLSQCLTEWLGPMFGDGLKSLIEPAVSDDSDTKLQWATLLAMNGAISAPELRRLSPFHLAESDAYKHLLIGGENMDTGNLISRGIGNIARNELAGLFADGLLDRMGLSGENGDADPL